MAKQESISENSQGQSTNPTFIKSNISFDLVGSADTEGNLTSIGLTRDSGDIVNQTVRIQIYQPPGNADSSDIIGLVQGITPLPVTPGVFPDLNSYFDITFTGNNLTTSFDFTIFDDLDFEGNESLVFKIVEHTNNDYNFFGNTFHTIAITDNDTTPTIYLTQTGFVNTSQSALEGATANIDIVLSAASGYDITATLTWSGLASSSDHDFNQQTVVIPAGSLTTTIPIALSADSYNERNEDLVISFASASGANITAGPSAIHTITINDATAGSTDIDFTTIGTALHEDAGSGTNQLTVTAQFAGTLEQNLTLPITFGGTATLGVDYTISSQNFHFIAGAPGPHSASVIVNIINDAIYEGVETLEMSFGATSFSTIGASSLITHSIAEDEVLPIVYFENPTYNANEGGIFNIPLKLNNAAFEDITVDYNIIAGSNPATSGVDHNLAVAGTFTIPAGSKNLNFPLSINTDAQFENDEKIYISISNPVGAGSSIDLAKDDLEITIKELGTLPTISFSSTYQNVSEGATAVITLVVDQASAIDQDFDLIVNELTATSGDYTPFATSQTLLAGQTSISINIPIIGAPIDLIDEPTEHLQISINQPVSMQVGANSSHSIYILDTTAPPTIDISSADLLLTEGDVGSFDIDLTGSTTEYNLSIPFTISGTAQYPSDMDIQTGTINIASGSASATISFNTFNDSFYEGPGTESIIVTLGSGANYTLGTSTITYTLSEITAAPTLSMEVPSYNAVENDQVDIAVNITTPLPNDLTVVLEVDDFAYAAGSCGLTGKCAHVVGDFSFHSNGVLISGMNFNNGATLGGIIPGTKERNIQFGASFPTAGLLAIWTGPFSTINFVAFDATNTDPDAVCSAAVPCVSSVDFAQKLAQRINSKLDEVIHREVYAFHKSGQDYITLMPRTPIFDTNLNAQLGAGALADNQVEVTIPAGTTRGVLSFQTTADSLYESGIDEYFQIQAVSTDNASVIIGAADITEVKISDIDFEPEASFATLSSIKLEGNTQIKIPVQLSNKAEYETIYKVKFYQTGSAVYAADKNDFVINDFYTNGAVTGMGSDTYSIPTQAGSIFYYSKLYDETNESGDYVDINGGDCSLTSYDSFNIVLSVPTNCDLNINYNGGTQNTGLLATAAMNTFLNSDPNLAELREHYAITAPFANTIIFTLKKLAPLTYPGNLIHETTITVKGETLQDYIVIDILDDILYETTEEMKIVLEAIAPSPAAQVVAGMNEHVLTISDNDAVPQINLITTAPASIIEGDSTVTDHTLLDSSPGSTDFIDLDYTIESTAINQHFPVDFFLGFSGATHAGEFTDITDIADYYQGDFIIDYSDINNPTEPAITTGTGFMYFQLPTGYRISNYNVTVRVHKDRRYENDENLVVFIAGANGANPSANSASQTTIQDDDTKPILIIKDLVTNPLTHNEKDEVDFDVTYEIASGEVPGFSGMNASEVSIQMDLNITLENRHGSSDNALAQRTVFLDVSNDFTKTETVSASEVGHIRSYKNIRMIASNPNEVVFFGLLSYCTLTECEKRYDFSTDDVLVKAGKIRYINYASWPANGFYGTTCSLHRGQVACFGGGGYGALGRGIPISSYGGNGEDVTNQSNVVDLGTDSNGNPLYVIDIAVGENHVCALTSTNQVKCWGHNQYGQLGIGSNIFQIGDSVSDMGNNLQAVDLGTSDKVKAIKAMAYATCAWFETGKVKCWGYNAHGQLGVESTATIGLSPSDMGTNLEYVKMPGNIVKFETGAMHSCALNDSSAFLCWGYGNHGQLSRSTSNTGHTGVASGDMTNANYYRNFNDLFATNINDKIEEITIGLVHTCVQFDSSIVSEFNTRCWGSNTYGQLGLGRATYAGKYTPNSFYPGISTYYSNILESLSNRGNDNYYNWEPWINTGNYVDASPILQDGEYIPHNSTSGTHTINVGVANNQWVQVRAPASKIGAGASYTCGVYTEDEVGARDPFMRCWGSNYVTKSEGEASPYHAPKGAATFGFAKDIGILNNIGWSKEYDGTGFIPYIDTGTGGTILGVDSCDSSPGSASCSFLKRLSVIGDDAASPTANGYLENYFDGGAGADHYYGWVNNLLGSGNRLNFELNYKYSEVAIDFAAQYVGGISDINLAPGDFHQCAIPIANSPTNDAKSSNKFTCWGSNGYGQSGVDKTPSFDPDPGVCVFNQVGGFNSCGDAKNGKFFELDYTY